MDDVSARRSERVAAILKHMPADASLKFAEAAGVFAPVRALLADEPETDEIIPGRIASASLSLIWRWISREVAPEEAAEILNIFTARALDLHGSTALDDAMARFHAALAARAPSYLDARSVDVLEDVFGATRLAHDARLCLGALSAPQEFLRNVPTGGVIAWADDARGVIARAPHAAPAYLCRLQAAQPNAADIVPLMLAVARRRDDHRLDQTDFVEALDAAAHSACSRGANVLNDPYVDLDDAQTVAADRFAQSRALIVAVRGHVTDAWLHKLEERLASRRGEFEAIARLCRARIEAVFQNPRDTVLMLQVDDVVSCARFLCGTADVAITLGFETARRDALTAISKHVSDSGAERLVAQAVALAEHSTYDSERFIHMTAGVIGVLESPAPAAAWARRARQAIGRPTFADDVLRAVEPLVVEEPKEALRRGLLSRDVVHAVWEWARAQKLAPDIDEAARDYVFQRELAPEAAEAIADRVRENIAEAIADRLALARLELNDGFPAGADLDQARIIAAMLGGDAEIAALVAPWPAKLRNLSDGDCSAIRRTHDELAARNPDVEPALLMLVMQRLERPWQIFRALRRIARTDTDTLIEETEFSAVGDVLIDEAADALSSFDVAREEAFYSQRALSALERFAGVTSGMVEELEIRRDGIWGRRLFGLKAAGARKLESLCRRAENAVEIVTPRVGARTWTPAVFRPVSERDVADAAEYARFIAEAKVLDERAAFAGARGRAMSAIDARLSSQINALLTVAHEGGQEERDAAQRHLRIIADVVRAFSGRDAAAIVRRRAAAA